MRGTLNPEHSLSDVSHAYAWALGCPSRICVRGLAAPDAKLQISSFLFSTYFSFNNYKNTSKCSCINEERDQQEQHFQPPLQQYFPQPPPQNLPQEFNWQELTQQFQGMRVEQNNQFQDFFDRQNSFFEEMPTQTKVYKQGFEDMRVQQHKYVEEIKASQEITHKAVLELRENQNKHINDFAAHKKEYRKDQREMKAAMEKSKAQFEIANQYWHRLNSKNEQKIDYLCWGVQQINPYLKGRLPEDILEWMQSNLTAGRGRFFEPHDGGSASIPNRTSTTTVSGYRSHEE
ncbi:hypothetical protein PIB30_030704 [Stylosanthes scabra]|uniref:Clathrin light chain n=1 Tax=Stylosanthes scabra TaxID=79078 RepID=A0ABU6TDG2_9FABA|nr:hypothetical protein [Stylosanthes scabra]